MKLPAWTRKVFAPVFSPSPSTTSSSPSNTCPTVAKSYPTTTSTPATSSSQIPKDDLAKSKASIQSYLPFSTLPNVRKRIPLLGVPDANVNSSATSLMSAIFFNHIRDLRASSCPEISKTSSSIVEGSIKPLAMGLEKNNDDDNDDGDEEEDEEDGEDVLDSPTTTTIYYYPPRPKKESTETSPSPSPSSSSSSSERLTNTSSSARFATSDPEVWCLRHIGLIPSAASTSSPELNHLRQYYQHLTHTRQHHIYHDKDCEFARRSALELSGQRPTPEPNADSPQRERDNLFLPLNPLQTNQSNSDKAEPNQSSSATSPPPSLPKLKSPVVPPFFNPPAQYQVRRSSANYSLELLKSKKRKSSISSTSQPTSRISDTIIVSSTSSNRSSSSNNTGCRHPQHSEDTIQELRESIRSMSHFGSTSPSSSLASKQATTSTSKAQFATKSGDPAVAVSNNDVPSPRAVLSTGVASHFPSPRPPRNSPLTSRAMQVSVSDPNASTTTTTTTVTTVTTAPVDTDNKLKHLIQKLDTLARE
ncbi:hypothetical protein BGZ97_013326, partial [Linnemannia gamsii]